MNKEEIDLLEIVFTLAIGECACNDIDNIQKLEDKIKTIGNLCKKQKEVIDKAIEYIEYEMPYLQETDKEYEDINGHTYYTYKEYDGKELLDILNEVSE